MKSSQFSAPDADLEARVNRFGLRIASGLAEGGDALTHDVSERLRFAREQALARAAHARAAATAAAAPQLEVVAFGSTLAFSGGPNVGGMGGVGGGKGTDLWAMLLSGLPLLLLVAGLLLMQLNQENEQIAAAAEFDTALLSDTLPPAAFTDPGFSEYLRDTEE
ncbi:MAG: DUF3619 family protein [Rubrivivax sp.]|nr:MAG: DUF3619 family protein [Rubrivivax sp.]